MLVLVSMATKTEKLRMRRDGRGILESWLRSRTLTWGQVVRTKIVVDQDVRNLTSRGLTRHLDRGVILAGEQAHPEVGWVMLWSG